MIVTDNVGGATSLSVSETLIILVTKKAFAELTVRKMSDKNKSNSSVSFRSVVTSVVVCSYVRART